MMPATLLPGISRYGPLLQESLRDLCMIYRCGLCCVSLCYLNCEYNSEHVSTLPFCLGPAFAALGFYAFGNYVRDNSSRFGFMLRPRLLTLSVSSVSLVALWWHNSAIQFFICVSGSGIMGLSGSFQTGP